MIGYIKGSVEEVLADRVIVDNHGIGYVILCPTPVLDELRANKGECKLFTYMYVREDQLSLFGFDSAKMLEMFELLITVNGIGPKAALAVLSTLSVSGLMLAIVSQDAKAIAKTPGVGPKSAQKVILELKDKIASEDLLYQQVSDTTDASDTEDNSAKTEAYMALVSLGYDNASASRAVNKVEDIQNKDTETILKEALKYMMG